MQAPDQIILGMNSSEQNYGLLWCMELASLLQEGIQAQLCGLLFLFLSVKDAKSTQDGCGAAS